MLKNFTFKDGLILLLVLSCIFFATPRKVRKAIKEQLLTRNAGPINHPTYPALEQKPFVIVIASYNNESVCELNLASVFSQHYTNYRVIYIDDASTDHTYERVKRVAEHHPIELIHNTSRQGKLTNLYRAYQSCADHEIIVCLDGDDWLAHPGVLQRLNLAYNNPDVWMTYGSAILHPNLSFHNKFIPKNIILKNTIRNFPFCMSMLRSFYAGLFKQIQLKDLFYQGQFLPTADDVGFMIPTARPPSR